MVKYFYAKIKHFTKELYFKLKGLSTKTSF